jgi:hypothetical protein
VRRGAAWPAKRPSSCLSWRWSSPVPRSVMPSESLLLSGPGWLMAPHGVCPAERPAGSQRQAPSPCSTMPGRQPGRRSPVRVQHAVSTHPVPWSGARRSDPSGVRPVRCPPVRCPVTWVRRPGSGGRPSGVHRPVSSPLVSAPSVRTRPSGPHQTVAVADRPRRQGNPHHGNGPRSLGAAASSSGSGRRPSRPGRGRRREVTHGRRGCR